MYCLDTNVVVRLLNGRSPALRNRFFAERSSGARLALPSIALFELRFGVASSAHPRRNSAALDRLIGADIDILPFLAEDAAEAGAIRAFLLAKGAPIGPYDILIAAQARRRGGVLVTANVKEFRRVPELQLEDWEA